MQATGHQESLSIAINFLEDILNASNGEIILENIKKFKQTSGSEEIELI